MIKYSLILIIAMGLFSCASKQKLETVKNVDIQKYAGVWYEIARLPNSFEKGLECITAQYTLLEKGRIEVINKGHLADNKNEYKDIKGVAKIPDPQKPGVLKVSFFRPFWGPYYIIALDEDYKYALVGSPSRKYLWILSRTKNLDENIYNDLLKTAKMYGFDTDPIIRIEHDCD